MSASTATDLPTTEVRERLVAHLLEHLQAMQVTGDEAPLTSDLEEHYLAKGETVIRVGDSLVIGVPDADDARPMVALVGHLDVVPPTADDREPRVEMRPDGEVVIGRGSSDMKAGNVIAMDLFADTDLRASAGWAMCLVLYAREEGPEKDNELADVLEAVPWLDTVDLAVVLEPTDGHVQVGCLGSVNAHVTITGKQAHSARPWHGHSAVDKALPLLAALAAREPVDVDVDGVAYKDVVNVTQAWTDSARNVIPGEFHLNVNFRFAPSRSADNAVIELRAMIDEVAGLDGIGFKVVDIAPSAPPRLSDASVQSFITSVGAQVTAKQAWTDVARFASVGVPALNYGPGLTGQAHQRGEYVPIDAMVDSWSRLRAFLAG
ncbi:MAG: succinyl-diaminopimelate desuccinylase [Glaciecola sp.]